MIRICGRGRVLWAAAALLAACGPPDLTILQQARSPGGRSVATAYTLGGGGAAGYLLYRVTLGTLVPDQRRFGPDDVAQLRHAHSLRVRWDAPDELMIIAGPEARVDTITPLQTDVRIRHSQPNEQPAVRPPAESPMPR
jgi:hypothetical protein